MTNGTLIRRLARADGMLLKPDRPLAPMDLMFSILAPHAARTYPDYWQGGRLWSTHATVAPENTQQAPELASRPTRRLVSHTGVDLTLHATVPQALANLTADGFASLMYVVVAVNSTTSFALQAADLYPAVDVKQQLVLWRSANAPVCTNGSDPVASGCVTSGSQQLMDASGDKSTCPPAGRCEQQWAVWQVSWAMAVFSILSAAVLISSCFSFFFFFLSLCPDFCGAHQ